MKKYPKKSRRSKIDLLKPVCWGVIPVVAIVILVLDALGIFIITDKRLIVIGVCLIIVLLPFFNEITVKDISVKRDKTKSGKNT